MLVNMTPEMVEKGLQLYAKKVAAGTKGTTAWDIGLALFERLPGWTVQRRVMPMPCTGNNLEQLGRGKVPKVPGVSATEPFNPSTTYAAAKKLGLVEFLASIRDGEPDRPYDVEPVRAAVTVGLPRAEDTVEGRVYVERFSVETIGKQEMVKNPHYEGEQYMSYPQRFLVLGKVWLGVRAAIITARESAGAPSVIVFDEPKAPGEFGSSAFYTWLSKTSIKADIAKTDLTKPPSAEDADRERIGSLDHSGVCPVCGRRQKMNGVGRKTPTMVDHGYQLPPRAHWGGYAEAPRRGSCFGVGFPPIELSPLGMMKVLEAIQQELPKAKRALKAHASCTLIRRSERRYDGTLRWLEYTPEHREWDYFFQRAQRELTDTYARLMAEEKFYEKAIAEWKRADTYDEHAAGEQFYRAPPLPSASPALDQVMARLRALDD